MASIRKNLDNLLISKVRIKALKYFIFNSDKPIHLRGAVRELKEEINAVRRELNRLDEIDLLISETKGNRKYYSLNSSHALLPELIAIFHKGFGLGGELTRNEKKLGSVSYAVLTGHYIFPDPTVKDQVDLVVVGQVQLDVLQDIIEEAQKQLGREIHYTVLKDHDFTLRKKRRDPFIMQLLIGYKIVVLGNELTLAEA